jgi:Rieske Fe-S protein
MSVSRRRFVKGTLASSTLLGVGALKVGCGNQVEPAPIVNATVGADGKVRVEVARYPDLSRPGGAVTLRFDLPESTPYPIARAGILLVHRGTADDPPEFVATQSACPHLGCPLGFNAGTQLIECPCHASRFRSSTDRDDPMQCVGKVVHLPARQDLTVFAVSYAAATQIATVDLNHQIPCGGRALPPVVGGKVVLPLADYPELASPGGFIVGQPDGLADSLIVYRVDATRVVALSSVCTHLNCDVEVASSRTQLECPCHGSVYDLDGTVRTGPAKRNLTAYAAVLDAASITVTV